MGTITQKLVMSVGTITVPATAEIFVAREKFVVDTSEDAEVKIVCFNEGFITHFIGGDGKVEPLQAECKRRYGFLLEREPTFPVITELGGEEKVETTLFEMFALLKMQSRGQKGVLVVNGYPNTFFIRDMFGVLCVVTGRWGDGGWVVRANLTKDFGTLPAGAQFFWPD